MKASRTLVMKLSCGMFRRLLTTYVGKSTEMNLMNSWPQKRNPLQVPMGFHIVSTGVLEVWVLNSLYNAYKHVIEGGPVPAQLAASRTAFIPKSSDVDNNGRIVRSPEAVH